MNRILKRNLILIHIFLLSLLGMYYLLNLPFYNTVVLKVSFLALLVVCIYCLVFKVRGDPKRIMMSVSVNLRSNRTVYINEGLWGE